MSLKANLYGIDIKHTIAYKLRWMLMLISGAVLCVVSLAYLGFGAINFYDATTFRLASISKVIGVNSSAALSFDDARTAEQLLLALNQEEDIKHAIIFDTQGKVFAKFVKQGQILIVGDHAEVGSLSSLSELSQGAASPSLSFDGIVVRSVIRFDGEVIGFIQIASSLTPLYKGMFNTLLLTLLLFLLGGYIVYKLSEHLQQQFTKPVEALVMAMEEVSQSQSYDSVLEVFSQDELGRLTRHFNGMLLQLKKRDEALESKTVEAIELAKKADQANQSKSQFLANMSHEIRTPLNGVIGLLRRMAKLPLEPKEALSYLHSAQQASNDLLALLNDILDFSKIEADSLQLESSVVYLDSFIQSSLVSLIPQIEEKRIGLTVKLVDVPTKFVSDPLRLRQIILNLVGNAVKFTTQGEVNIQIQTRKNLDVKNEVVLDVLVKDTGVGMSKVQLDKIFTAFTQADESTTRKFGGTGLGLNIAKRLIEIMGGHLQVKSELHHGTEFSFTLPVSMHPDAIQVSRIFDFTDIQTQPQQQIAPQMTFSGEKVLLAEDNMINQLVAKEELEDMNLQVVCVDNGLEAVKAWQGGDFDLVLMDVHMPEMDGLEATRKIRSLETSEEEGIPIVALTANAMKEDFDRCITAGMNDYVTKPFHPQQLASKIKRNLTDVDKAGIERKSNTLHSGQHSLSGNKSESHEASFSMPMMGETLLDEGKIKQFKKSSIRLLEQLRDGIVVDLGLLDEAVTDKAWDDYALHAHKMIGSCMIIKGTEMPRLLRSMQLSGEQKDEEACQEKFFILSVYVSKVSKEAKEYLEHMEKG